MTLLYIIQEMNKIPYATLQAFIEESYNYKEYADFVRRSCDAMDKHDPKGFRIDEICCNIFGGDEDAIINFIKSNLK